MVPPPGDDNGPDSNDDLDELFGADEDVLFNDPETSLFSAEGDASAEKASDSLDMLDLSANSNDEFEIDSGLTPSSISVKSDEEAIGLEDMERALDEMDQSSDQSSDEALASMWEQSLQNDSDDDDNFDLADNGSAGKLDDDLVWDI